jgi:hypothetical protein
MNNPSFLITHPPAGKLPSQFRLGLRRKTHWNAVAPIRIWPPGNSTQDVTAIRRAGEV